ncbi:hypothetical protein JL720_8990 [Aureococcus anophagefferens]|nr:hypothetical protein JL720_8990 [Aureococcus anophagefferens]
MQYATAKTVEARKARKNLTNVSPEDLNGFGPAGGSTATAAALVAVGHCTFIFLGKGKLKGAAKIVPVGAGDELCRAAYVGDVGALGRLLDGGAPVDGRDGWGETPLGRAATRGRVDAVRLLLGRGASADAADDGGRAARLLLGTQTGTQPAKAPKEAATWQEKQREYERKKARAKEFRLRLTCTIWLGPFAAAADSELDDVADASIDDN